MKLVAFPRDANPYQRLLYDAMAAHGVRVRYAGELTPSHTLNLLLLPLELTLLRLRGWRALHLHWVHRFAPPGAGRVPGLRRLAQIWFACVLAWARVLGLRIVWTAHNVLPHEPVFADDAAARRTLVRAADLVLVHSPAALAGLAELGAAPRRSLEVPHGPFAPAGGAGELRPAGAGAGARRLLCFGKVLPYKGVEELLEAAAALPPQSALTLTVAGECSDPALRERVRALAERAGERVELRLERVPEAEVTELLAAADGLVLPYRAATTSGVAALALAHGRPLVIPDLPALAQLPAAATLRYDATTPGLTAALAALAAWPRERFAAAAAAAAAHGREHSWEEAARLTADALGELERAPRARPPRRVGPAALARRVSGDAFYRGSALLLANTVLLAAFGFAFWAVAARTYATSSVGTFSGVSSAVILLGAVGGLGLSNTFIRHLARSEHARELALAALVAVVSLGSALCLAVVELLGPHLPASLHLADRGGGTGLLMALVAVAAASAVTDAGLISLRATRELLLKNLAGSVLKLALVVPLEGLGTPGLVLAFGAGALLSAALGVLALWRQLPPQETREGLLAALRRHAGFSLGSYGGIVLGTLPLTVVPLLVLAQRGPTEAAWFAVAFLLVAFVNFIPSTAAQVLFAEASREPGPLRAHVVKAARAVYGLLIPCALVLALVAPWVLRLFGEQYSAGATDTLRLLAAGCLATGGTYLIDAVLTSRDRISAYVFMNAANTVLVLVAVGLLLGRGLAWGAAGWAIAQGLSLLLGLVVLRASGAWRIDRTSSRRGGEGEPRVIAR